MCNYKFDKCHYDSSLFKWEMRKTCKLMRTRTVLFKCIKSTHFLIPVREWFYFPVLLVFHSQWWWLGNSVLVTGHWSCWISSRCTECLEPYLPITAGFLTQRLTDRAQDKLSIRSLCATVIFRTKSCTYSVFILFWLNCFHRRILHNVCASCFKYNIQIQLFFMMIRRMCKIATAQFKQLKRK